MSGDDLHIRVIQRHTGEWIRELILDPPGTTNPADSHSSTHAGRSQTRAASRSGPDVPPAAEVKAGRRLPAQGFPALTPGEDGAAGMPKQHADATMSRDTC